MLTKYVTTGASGESWFSMHDTPEEAIRAVQNDTSGMTRMVMRWAWTETENVGHKIYEKRVFWCKPLRDRDHEPCEGYVPDRAGDTVAASLAGIRHHPAGDVRRASE